MKNGSSDAHSEDREDASAARGDGERLSLAASARGNAALTPMSAVSAFRSRQYRSAATSSSGSHAAPRINGHAERPFGIASSDCGAPTMSARAAEDGMWAARTGASFCVEVTPDNRSVGEPLFDGYVAASGTGNAGVAVAAFPAEAARSGADGAAVSAAEAESADWPRAGAVEAAGAASTICPLARPICAVETAEPVVGSVTSAAGCGIDHGPV